MLQRRTTHSMQEKTERTKKMKTPFITKAKAEEIIKEIPTPFHIYDEEGIRENARKLYKAFSWNKGFKEYFAVKATPNPTILKILKEEAQERIRCSCYAEKGCWELSWKR